MAHIAPNADVYAEARVGIFFPGVDPSLDGQCVSLVKYFMGEMSDVPNWNAGRGDARYVGHTLVNQGHAVEVPYAERQRGDIICYEFGTYGHTAVQLSAGRVFEENVNWPGTTSKLVDGAYVYSARIGSENESWRANKNPHIYRLKTYLEENNIGVLTMPTEQQVKNFIKGWLGYDPSKDQIKVYTTNYWWVLANDVVPAYGRDLEAKTQKQIDTLNARIKELESSAGFAPVDQLYIKKVS